MAFFGDTPHKAFGRNNVAHSETPFQEDITLEPHHKEHTDQEAAVHIPPRSEYVEKDDDKAAHKIVVKPVFAETSLVGGEEFAGSVDMHINPRGFKAFNAKLKIVDMNNPGQAEEKSIEYVEEFRNQITAISKSRSLYGIIYYTAPQRHGPLIFEENMVFEQEPIYKFFKNVEAQMSTTYTTKLMNSATVLLNDTVFEIVGVWKIDYDAYNTYEDVVEFLNGKFPELSWDLNEPNIGDDIVSRKERTRYMIRDCAKSLRLRKTSHSQKTYTDPTALSLMGIQRGRNPVPWQGGDAHANITRKLNDYKKKQKQKQMTGTSYRYLDDFNLA